jgi:uncharacterized protein
MIKPKITLDEKKIKTFCKKHHILKLALFGSVLTDAFKRTSDVDFLVYFDKKHIPGLFGISSMERELTEIIGRKADLRTPFDLSPYFRDEVITESKCIYG